MNLRVAVVGCGSSGTRRAHVLRALGVESLTFIDQDAKRARRLQATLGGEVAFSAAAGATEADAVLVCTPPASRVGLAMECVQAGAHVFVEAPVGDNLAGAELLLQAADTRDRTLMVASPFRFHPALERIRSLLEARAFGRVYAVYVWIGAGMSDDPDADSLGGRVRASGGGPLLPSVYWFDAVRWLFGAPFDVTGVYGNVYPNTNAGESLCAAIVRLASGAVVQLYADAFRGAEATRIEVVGTDGTVRWSADRHEITIQRSYSGAGWGVMGALIGLAGGLGLGLARTRGSAA